MDLFAQTAREAAIDELHGLTAIYTHEPVVDDLLDNIDWPNGNKRLLDPSAGAGVFMCRALERLLLTQSDIDDARLVHVLSGYEIHPHAVTEARANLARILSRHGRSTSDAKALAQIMVREGDFLLDSEPDQRFDAVVTNPPYLRMQNVPELLREDYLRSVPDYANGDMLYAFLDLCSRRLTADGEVSLITADRWLQNEGAAGLRSAIGEKLGIAHLERVDVASAFHRPKLRRQGTPPRVHPVLVVLKRAGDDLQALGPGPIYPGVEDCGDWTGPTLADIATVRIAPWLGSAGIFVVDAETARHFPPEELVPAVDTDDIVEGKVQPAKRFALRTWKGHEPSPAVLAHLDATLHQMAPRGRRATRWLPPESFETFDLTREQLLIPRIGRTLKPVRLPAGVLPINHNLTVVGVGEASLERIEAALLHPAAQAWAAARADRLENGYYSYKTRFLRGLPLFG